MILKYLWYFRSLFCGKSSKWTFDDATSTYGPSLLFRSRRLLGFLPRMSSRPWGEGVKVSLHDSLDLRSEPAGGDRGSFVCRAARHRGPPAILAFVGRKQKCAERGRQAPEQSGSQDSQYFVPPPPLDVPLCPVGGSKGQLRSTLWRCSNSSLGSDALFTDGLKGSWNDVGVSLSSDSSLSNICKDRLRLVERTAWHSSR